MYLSRSMEHGTIVIILLFKVARGLQELKPLWIPYPPALSGPPPAQNAYLPVLPPKPGGPLSPDKPHPLIPHHPNPFGMHLSYYDYVQNYAENSYAKPPPQLENQNPGSGWGGWSNEPPRPQPNCSWIWVNGSGGSFPPEALVGGEEHGEKMYVVHVNLSSSVVPGKLIPSHHVALIPFNGLENLITNYEVLVITYGDVKWTHFKGIGTIPTYAIPTGETSGETLFSCRTKAPNRALTVGKFQPSTGKCELPYGGNALPYTSFDILTIKDCHFPTFLKAKV